MSQPVAPADKPATVAQVATFFRQGTTYTLSDFKKDWDLLTDKDKNDLKVGIGNHTFTY